MPETPKKGKKRKAGKEPVEKKEKKQKKEKKKKKGKEEAVAMVKKTLHIDFWVFSNLKCILFGKSRPNTKSCRKQAHTEKVTFAP